MDSSHEARRRAAARWTVARDRGMSPTERAEFDRWLAADPRNAGAFESSSEAWAMLDDIPECVARPLPCGRLGEPSRAHAANLVWIPLLGVAAAAALAVAILEVRRPAPEAPARAAAAPPALARVEKLGDGTVVSLDSGSEVAERFTPMERRVELLRGRAYFEVSRDPARPFVVSAGSVRVRALGTAFDVMIEPASVEVLVTDGRVSVASDPGPGAPAGSGPVVEVPVLAAGQRALVALAHGAGGTPADVSTLRPRELADAMAWQDPLVNLGGSTLADLAAEFRQRTGQRLVLADPELAALRIGGRFHADDVAGFVRLLQDNYGVDAESRDGQVILSFRKGNSDRVPGGR